MKLFGALLIGAGLFAALLFYGCDNKSKVEATKHTNDALSSAGKALKIAMDSALKRAGELSDDSSPSVQDACRSSLLWVQTQLKKAKPSPEVQKQLDSIQKAIEKIDAQKAWSSAKKGVTDMVEKAKRAGETVEDAKKKLKETDEKFRDAEKKMEDARKRYDEAKSRLSLT